MRGPLLPGVEIAQQAGVAESLQQHSGVLYLLPELSPHPLRAAQEVPQQRLGGLRLSRSGFTVEDDRVSQQRAAQKWLVNNVPSLV